MTDFDRVAVRLTDPPDTSTIVEAEAVPQPSTVDADVIGTATRQIDEIAATFTDQARRLAGEGTGTERLGRLAQTMRSEWDLDPGAPGAGLQQALIDMFITETQRGIARAVRHRVCTARRGRSVSTRGLPPGSSCRPTSSDRRSSCVPTSRRSGPRCDLPTGPGSRSIRCRRPRRPTIQVPPLQRPAQTPAAAQPPIAPPAEDESPDDEVVLDVAETSDGWGTATVWAARVGTVTGLVLAPFLIAIGVVLWLKWRRTTQADRPGARGRVSVAHGRTRPTRSSMPDCRSRRRGPTITSPRPRRWWCPVSRTRADVSPRCRPR